MIRYPRKFKRIKHVQEVERPIPGYTRLLPVNHPELFGDANSAERKKLKKELVSKGWRKVRFKDCVNGTLIVYGHCLRDSSVLHGAIGGHYDLYLEPPNLGTH